jgi:hypothetical protein
MLLQVVGWSDACWLEPFDAVNGGDKIPILLGGATHCVDIYFSFE